MLADKVPVNLNFTAGRAALEASIALAEVEDCLTANAFIKRLSDFPWPKHTLKLDGPGIYYYGSTTGNDEGRGLTGAIAVGGDTPDHAKEDRPPQPRP